MTFDGSENDECHEQQNLYVFFFFSLNLKNFSSLLFSDLDSFYNQWTPCSSAIISELIEKLKSFRRIDMTNIRCKDKKQLKDQMEKSFITLTFFVNFFFSNYFSFWFKNGSLWDYTSFYQLIKNISFVREEINPKEKQKRLMMGMSLLGCIVSKNKKKKLKRLIWFSGVNSKMWDFGTSGWDVSLLWETYNLLYFNLE